ncbi:MAG TPA: ATP-binding protein [Kutzneria sp.]|nr:ATP-binding protein [Kutzneria sp.]
MTETQAASNGEVWKLDLDHTRLPPLVEVRRWCGRVLVHLSEAHLSDVLLAAVEMLTNAYDHGGGARQVRLSHARRPCSVRIEVDDHTAERPRVVGSGRADQKRGRGVILLDRLADDWGTRDLPEGGGKCVWAVISCSGSQRVPCRSAGGLPQVTSCTAARVPSATSADGTRWDV